MRHLAKLLALPLVALSFLPFAMPAMSATLTGDSVTSQYYFPTTGNLFGTDTSTVGAGTEISCPGSSGACGILLGTYAVDFGTDTIDFSQFISTGSNLYNPGAFNGWVFSGLTFGTGISSLGLTSYGIAGLSLANFSFTADTVTVNLQGLAVDAENGWSLTLNPAAVPVPASGALLLAGLGGLALIRRRRA